MLQERFGEQSPRQKEKTSGSGGTRVIRDHATGEMISVSERSADRITGARAPRCLVFSSDRGFTRLWDYPAEWDDLPDAELLALFAKPLNYARRQA